MTSTYARLVLKLIRATYKFCIWVNILLKYIMKRHIQEHYARYQIKSSFKFFVMNTIFIFPTHLRTTIWNESSLNHFGSPNVQCHLLKKGIKGIARRIITQYCCTSSIKKIPYIHCSLKCCLMCMEAQYRRPCLLCFLAYRFKNVSCLRKYIL